jgi:hypothetical protein
VVEAKEVVVQGTMAGVITGADIEASETKVMEATGTIVQHEAEGINMLGDMTVAIDMTGSTITPRMILVVVQATEEAMAERNHIGVGVPVEWIDVISKSETWH